jgi:hypothetical protein
MLASQHAFFGNILDYAGMFPPAQLPLDASIRNYLQYQSEPESWLLARFICPAGRLHDLRPYVTKHVSGRSPLRISVLGSGGDTAAPFLRCRASSSCRRPPTGPASQTLWPQSITPPHPKGRAWPADVP